MHNKSKISPFEVRKIQTLFPDLDKLIEDDIPTYKQLPISVFTHSLTLEEADKYLDNVPKNIERIRTNKLFHFLVSLYKAYDCYLVIYNNIQDRHEYQKIISSHQIKVALQANRVQLVIPILQVVYLQGFDFTHLIYYKKRNKLDRLIHLVKRSGLYILD